MGIQKQKGGRGMIEKENIDHWFANNHTWCEELGRSPSVSQLARSLGSRITKIKKNQVTNQCCGSETIC
jgi:hypothetical protein